jgi:hypothetical protein
LVRFELLVAKTQEICQEVKSLGANLLSAIEKHDNESLSLLRAQHENAILQLAEMVKYAQWQDAQKATQALQLSLATATPSGDQRGGTARVDLRLPGGLRVARFLTGLAPNFWK